MSKHVKTVCIIMVKILLSFLAFYVISKRVTINPATYLNHDSIYYFLLGLAFSVTLIFIQAWRWKNIVKITSINLSYQKSVIAVWTGHLINNLLPTATAGDLVRSYTLKYADNQKSKWKWLGAFLSEKYSAATSALLLASISLITPISNQLPVLLMVLIVAILGMVLIIPFVATKMIASFKLTTTRLINYIYNINIQLANSFLNKNGRYAFILSFFINLGMCLIFYIITAGFGTHITFAQCMFVVPVFTLLASLPISYAGWGVRELSCVALLQYFGVPGENAVIISVMYGLLQLLSCTPGIFVAYLFFSTAGHKEHATNPA